MHDQRIWHGSVSARSRQRSEGSLSGVFYVFVLVFILPKANSDLYVAPKVDDNGSMSL
jgi:hypothetical protein